MQAVSPSERFVCACIQQILEYVSRFMTLFPGDVILTGRPPPLDGFPPYGVPVEASDTAKYCMPPAPILRFLDF